MAQKNIYKTALKALDAGGMVKEPLNKEYDLIPLIRKGLLMKNLQKLAEQMSLSLKDLALILPVSERTLRRYGALHRLSPEITERVLKLAQLYSRGIQVFERKDKFLKWLNTEITVLNGKKPVEYLDTSKGIDLILEELERIEYGVYS
jgi:putative toxin-antitoxin system antitoxin component (TIGR02293 family)